VPAFFSVVPRATEDLIDLEVVSTILLSESVEVNDVFLEFGAFVALSYLIRKWTTGEHDNPVKC
jgi:hypothetical protein